MRQMKRITLRLSLENPTDKKIADFLANIDRNKYHTVNNAIKTILFSVQVIIRKLSRTTRPWKNRTILLTMTT